MARSAQRKKFRAWARARGLDLNGCQETAYKVWLHCRLEEEQKNNKARTLITETIKELEALNERIICNSGGNFGRGDNTGS
jgi:hypothetical protein